MKGKKYGIIVSVITMIISLVLILLFNWCDKEKYELLLNIIIGVLGSSVVTLIISISDYIVAKREALEEYFSQVYKIIIAFGKIKYVHITDRVLESAKYKTECELKKCFGAKTSTMDSIMEYYDENNYWDNYCEKLSLEEKEQIILEQIEKDCADIEKAMNYYLDIDNLSYEAVENAFGRISFLFDKSEKHPNEEKYFRVWIYRNLHEKLRNMINTIRLENFHFKAYKEGENKNILVLAEKIDSLNKKMFEIISDESNGYSIKKVYAKFFNDAYGNLEKFRARIYNCEEQKHMVAPVYTIQTLKDENTGSET